MSTASHSPRLVEIDALRGIAALSVVLFHYTTQFKKMYSPGGWTDFEFTHGHLGVNLFFIISGFVIFMTLERTKVPLDFVVSRFSRLYPAYWFSVACTFAITHWLGLPGKLVDVGTALANGLMFHGFFKVAHVDGVYWTLEVELLFYAGMLFLFSMGRLRHVFQVALLLLVLRWVYFFFEKQYGVDLPFIILRVFILRNLPWFIMGLAIYTHTQAGLQDLRRMATVAAALAVGTIAVVEGLLMAGVAATLCTVVLLAARGKLSFLRLPWVAWLGSISYPLYLLHENIGWSLLLQAQAAGWHPWLAILVVLVVITALSHFTTQWVEQPAMRGIRAAWKRRSAAAALPS